MDKIKKILEFAMRMEKDAMDFYSFYVDKISSQHLKGIFEELVNIERIHHETLKRKYEELSYEEPPIALSWVVDDTSAARDPHILSDSSDLLSYKEDESEQIDLSIIRMAFLIENDFSEFYKHAVSSIEDSDVRKLLMQLSDWENKHKEYFQRKYNNLLKKHWDEIYSILFT
ncbi:MAG: ferritin family protein [Ignavibacteria bacterium]|nr:ferritin family protein [Ignavibacteria bacterium]